MGKCTDVLLPQVPLTPPGRSLEYSRQLSQQPSAADVGGLAMPGHRPPGVAAPASLLSTPSKPPKAYGPLTKSITAVPGSMLVMSDSMRNIITRHSEASAGDVGMRHSDQCPPADLHGHVLLAAQVRHLVIARLYWQQHTAALQPGLTR